MKKIIALGIGSFFLWSCANHSDKKPTDQQETENHAEHHHDENAKAIELNNGERWIVNEEMKPFALKGSELVNTYIQNNQTGYKELASQLKEQNDQLIKSCTMKGKSHEELHKWLYPHLELVKKLGQASNDNEATTIIHQLEISYREYQNYFQ